MTSARRTGPALEAMYRFMPWLIPAVEKFPRSQKFLLGDRIQATALDVLERLIEATYTRACQGAPRAGDDGRAPPPVIPTAANFASTA